MSVEFKEFPKIPRLTRECIITEKLDGTNAQVYITDDGQFLTGSRNRWITPEDDNYGFSKWAHANKDELLKLGPGQHFGEWWGQGIQRSYGMKEKRFSLFNVKRWADDSLRPSCCHVVPLLFRGIFDSQAVHLCLDSLVTEGSRAAPGFMNPEGVIIYHIAAGVGFKKTIKKDEEPKGFNRETPPTPESKDEKD